MNVIYDWFIHGKHGIDVMYRAGIYGWMGGWVDGLMGGWVGGSSNMIFQSTTSSTKSLSFRTSVSKFDLFILASISTIMSL